MYKVWYWRLKNLPAYIRSLFVLTGVKLSGLMGNVSAHGRLYIKRYDAKSGTWLNYGFVSARSVTDAGVAYLTTDWLDDSKNVSLFSYHGCGTGAVAENVTDVALGADSGVARVLGVKTKPLAGQLQTVATLAFTGPLAITEHGIFDQIVLAGSTLWDRSVFAPVNVVSGDSIQFTYLLTVNSGG